MTIPEERLLRPSDAALAGLLRRFGHEAMACMFEVLAMGHEPAYLAQAAAAAFAEVDALEQQLSRFVPHSDIARVNVAAVGVWVRIGPAAVECLVLAEEVRVMTEGAFDVTVGAMEGGGLEIDRESMAVRRLGADVRVDLGAIGKGFAVDRAAEVLREWGVTTALVHSGQSSLMTVGKPPGMAAWTIAVRDPRDPGRILETVRLHDQAVSGSGVVIHGPHIVDPRTGKPAERSGAWAIAPTAAMSDALSTAFMVMTPEAIHLLCEKNPEAGAMVLLGSSEAVRAGLW